MTAILTGGLLATARRAAGDLMTDTCVVKREAQTADGAGGFTSSWATLATTTCSVQPISGDELRIAEQLKVEASYAVFLPNGQDATEKDRVEQTTGATTTYELIAVLKRAGQEAARKCLARVVVP